MKQIYNVTSIFLSQHNAPIKKKKKLTSLTFICYPLGLLHHGHGFSDWCEGCHVTAEAVVIPFMIS